MYKKKPKKVKKMAYGSGKKGVKKMQGGGYIEQDMQSNRPKTAYVTPTQPQVPPSRPPKKPKRPPLRPLPNKNAGIDSPLSSGQMPGGVRRFKDGGMACGGRAARQARQRSV